MKQTKFKMLVKVIFAVVLPIVTILSMTFLTLPKMSTSNAASTVQYLDENGEMQTATDAIEVNSVSGTTTPVNWTDGTYVVTGEKTLSCSIRVDGDVTLILRDNATLTCNGISVYNYHGEKLTICAQSTGSNMGTLKAQVKGSTTTDNGQAGIGGGYGQGAGTIIINGGNIIASGHPGARIWPAPGIGSGAESSGGMVIINGGVVKAVGETIVNGDVKRSTGGIYVGDAGTLTIADGMVVRTGDSYETSDIVKYPYDYAIEYWKNYVEVTYPVAVTKISGDLGNAKLVAGDQEYKITPIFEPANATYNTLRWLSWKSNNEKVATVTNDGTVWPHSAGETTITFVANNGTPDDTSDDKTGTLVLRVFAAESVTYRDYDANGNFAQTNTCNEYVHILNSTRKNWGTENKTSWYVVKNNITIDHATVSGNVNLILMDGASLTCSTGMSINGNLTVYAQSTDKTQMGKLVVTSDYDPAIDGGNITVNGGNLTVTGRILIYLEGQDPDSHYFAIKSNATINGGSLVVSSGVAFGGNVSIGPEMVVKVGKEPITDFETNHAYHTVTIDPYVAVTSITLDKTSLSLKAEDDVVLLTPTVGAENASYNTLNWVEWRTSNENVVKLFDNRGKILPMSAGTATITAVANNGTTDTSDDIYATCVVTVSASSSVSYLSYNASNKTFTESSCAVYTTITENTTAIGATDWTRWHVAKGNVTINGRINVNGEVHLILADGASLTVNGGIHVPTGSSLTIYGHSTNKAVMGQLLTQNAGVEQAGIGGNSLESNGSIVINGGKVTSYGGERGAGIGGGGADDADAPAAGSITINGGVVTAIGGEYAAGIGGGGSYYNFGGEGYSIALNGGEITAQGSYAIGGGNSKFKESGNYGHFSKSQNMIVKGGNDAQNVAIIDVNSNTDLHYTYNYMIVSEPIKVTSIALNRTNVSITGDERFVLTVTFGPDNASYNNLKYVNWTSSDPNVAMIMDDGSIIPVKAGTATITVIANNGTPNDTTDDIYATCSVTVTTNPTKVSYLDYNTSNGTYVTKNLSSYSFVYDDVSLLGVENNTSWYVVKNNITFNSRIQVRGEVNLVLMDGATLNANDGIEVTGNNKLTIYAQSSDKSTMGVLNASTDKNDTAAIGGSVNNSSCGTITIVGGNITANGGNNGAGIGGAFGASGGAVNIYGGIVTAYASNNASAIGNRNYSLDGIQINISKKLCVDVNNNILANPNVVWKYTYAYIDLATPVSGLTLNQNSLNMVAGTKSVQLMATITPNNATYKTLVWTSSNENVAKVDGNGNVTPIWSGTATITVTATNGTEFTSDDVTATCVVTVSAVSVSQISLSSTELNLIAEGETSKLTATISPENVSYAIVVWTSSNENVAKVDANGVVTPVGQGTAIITATATNGTETTADDKTANCTVTVILPNTLTYLDYDADVHKFVSATCTTYATLSSETTTWGTAGETKWIVAESNVEISSAQIIVLGDVRFIIKDNVTVTAKCGLLVKNGNSLTIYAQSQDESTMGKLNSNGTYCAAGIGGQYGDASGNITINGGFITAVGGQDSAGIGGGNRALSNSNVGGDSGKITINGGIITATGNGRASGIGGGGGANKGGNAGEIIINGGTITATGSGNGAGIGGGGSSGGNAGSASKITINNGTVNATAGNGYGAGIGGGGEQDAYSGGSGGTIVINRGTVNADGKAGRGVGGGGMKHSSNASYNYDLFTGDDVLYSYENEGTIYHFYPKPDVESVTIEPAILELFVGGSDVLLTASITPSGANTNVVWSSSNSSVVAVDSNGRVIPRGLGTATITATATNGTVDTSDDKTATITITVNPPPAVTGIELNYTTLELNTNHYEEYLKATISPNGANNDVVWTTSDSSVATVDRNGKVSAVGVGTATITATATNGTEDTSDDKTATCTIIINELNFDIYYEYDYYTHSMVERRIAGCETITSNLEYLGDWDNYEKWYIVRENITFDEEMWCEGDSDIHLILANGVTLTFNQGVGVSRCLTIYAQSTDIATMGKLVAKSENGAGINCQTTLIINGGIITATGGNYCAGIGGSEGSHGGYITINGGVVTAIGGEYAAGIGGGSSDWYGGDGGRLTINGGEITAVSGGHGAMAIGYGVNYDTEEPAEEKGEIKVGKVILIDAGDNAESAVRMTNLYSAINEKYIHITIDPNYADSVLYEINIDAENANISLSGNGVSGSSALSGETVTITIDPSEGYDFHIIKVSYFELMELDSVEAIKNLMGNAYFYGSDLTDYGGPNSDGFYCYIDYNGNIVVYNGPEFIATLDEKNVKSITMEHPIPEIDVLVVDCGSDLWAFQIGEYNMIQVSLRQNNIFTFSGSGYANGSLEKRVPIETTMVMEGREYTFVMPDKNVVIMVDCIRAYNITKETENGDVVVTVNGKEVNKAGQYDEVVITVNPEKGYELENISVYLEGFALHDVEELATLMGDAVFQGLDRSGPEWVGMADYSAIKCKVVDGYVSLFNGDEFICSLTDSDSFEVYPSENNPDIVSVLINDWDDYSWFFLVEYKVITRIETYHGGMIFLSEGASIGELSSELDIFTITEGKVYTFDMPAMPVRIVATFVEATAHEHNSTTLEYIVAKDATCEEAGNIAYYHCTICGCYFADAEGQNEITLERTVIPALGHNWGEVTYEWSEDNKTCTATRVCLRDNAHIETETVKAVARITQQRTTSLPEITTYIVVFENPAFETQTKANVQTAEPYEITENKNGDKVISENLVQNEEKDVTNLFSQAVDEDTSVEIKSGDLTIEFNSDAVSAIAGNDVKLTANVITENIEIENAELVLEITLEGATFAEGKATLAIPLNIEVQSGEVVKVYYIDAYGNRTDMNATFVNGIVTFETNHFSTYVVVISSVSTVTLHANGGTINSENIVEYTEGEKVILPTNVTRENYTFAGWFDNAELQGSAVTEISSTATGDKEFWAKWKAIVSFTKVTDVDQINADNIGECTLADVKEWVNDNWEDIINTSAYYVDIAYFEGTNLRFIFIWDFSNKETACDDISTLSVDAVKSYYSGNGDDVWICTKYKEEVISPITLHTNGGTINSGNVTEYIEGVGVTLPTDVTRKNYTFDGWYDNAEFQGSKVREIPATATGNKEFWARWIMTGEKQIFVKTLTGKTYTIWVDMTDTILVVKEKVVDFAKETDFTEIEYSKVFLVFAGKWLSDDTKTLEQCGIQKESTLHLIVGYLVTFNSNGGSEVASKPAREGATITAPADPTKENHIFNGWYKESGLINIWDFENDTVTEDITLYAKWTEKLDITELTFAGYNGIYNGNGHGVIVTGDTTNYNITYSSDGVNYNLTETPTYTNVGTYTIYYKVEREGYNTLTGSVEIKIGKATYDMSGVTFTDAQFTYDGTSKSIEISGTLPEGVTVQYTGNGQTNASETAYVVTATFTGDADNYNAIPNMTAYLTINKATYDMSGVTFTDAQFTYDGTSKSIAISGTLPAGVSVEYTGNGQTNARAKAYVVTASFTGDADNYNAIPDMTANLKIKKANCVLTAPTGISGLVYTGEAQALVTAGEVVGGTIWYTLDLEYYSTDIPTGINVKRYSICYKVIGDENHNDINKQYVDDVVIIAPATLTNVSVAQSGTLTYSGEPQTANVTTSATSVNNQTVTFTYSTEEEGEFTATVPAFTTAGTHTVYFEATAPNHSKANGSFEVTIGKATYDMSGVTFANTEFTYDGTSKSIEISGTLPAGVTVEYTNNGQTNASATAYVVTATFTGDANNYNAIPDMTANLTINKATYDMSGVTFVDAQFTYDGTSKSIEISGTLPTGVTVQYTGNGQTNASATAYVVTATFTGDANNYNAIPDMTAYLTINKKALTVTANDKTATYGDEVPEYTVSYDGFVAEEDAIVLGGTLVFACDYEQFDGVNTYTITPSGLTSGNYEITYANGTLTVVKKAITVTIVEKTSVYGEAQVELDATTDGIVNNDKVYTLTCDVNETTSVGTYDIVGTIVNDNYYVTFANQEDAYEVTPATLTNVSVEQVETLTYNGEAQTAEVTTNAIAVNEQEVTFTYSVDGETYDEMPAFTNADTYIVYYKVTAPNHNEATGNFEVVIGKKALKVTANDKKVTYGDEAPEYTVSYDGFVAEENETVLDGTLAFACEYKQFDGVGTYTITPSGYTSDNYEITFVEGTLTVNAKAITVTIVNKTSVYGEAQVELTATDNGIVNNDKVYTLACDVNELSNVGRYNITGTKINNNYTVTFENQTNAYEVTPATLTNVSVEQSEILTYTGEAQTAEVATNATAVNEQEVTFTYSVDGETYGEMPAFTNADTYTVYYKVTAANHNDYTGSFVVTIGKKALKVTANNKKVTYGDLAPEFTVKYNGFVVGETYTVLGGELKFACEYKQFDSVGTYKITPSGLESNNYEITFIDGKLTVAQKAIIVTIVNKTSVYGEVQVALEATTAEGAIVNGDEVYTLSCGVKSTSKVGKYNITGKAINANYKVTFENQTSAYEVTPATLTGVSVSQYKALTYNGKAQTASVAKTAKAVNNQNVTFAYRADENETYTSSVPAFKDAGTYTVYYKVTEPNHYDYTGSFEVTIGKKALTVTANDKKTTYGSEAPEFTVKYNGFAKGETSEVLGGTLEFACEYKQFDGVGTYEITPSGLESDNYEITFVDGTLTVNPKAITVTIVKKTSVYGEEPAKLEATTVEGAIVNGDTDVYELSCEVTSASVVGKYNITGTALDANYNVKFVYEKDAYTVKKRAITLAVEDKTIKVEEELPELTFTLSEEVSAEVLEELTGKVVLITNADATKAGKYLVKAKFAENYYSSNVLENYTVTLESGELTVLAKVLKDETAVADVEVSFDNNEDAFPYEVKVEVDVVTITQTEDSELDYSAITAQYVDKKSEITKVYSIKLLKTIIENGEEKLVEVQPNEVKEGTTIVIKIEIPEELAGKNFRVLHIHSAEDVEYVDEANVEVKDGFAYVKVNRLSEFAFVTKKATHGFCSGWIFFIIDCVLVACFVVYLLLKRNKVLGLIGLIAILAAIVFGTIVLCMDSCLIAVISMYLAMLVFGLFLTCVLLGQKNA